MSRRVDLAQLEELKNQADDGVVEAMVDWATLFLKIHAGEPISEADKQQVLDYYTAGMEADIPYAYTNLGAEYYGGGVFDRDYAKAEALYARAAELGDVRGMCNLAYCYYYARNAEKPNYEAAFRLFDRGAVVYEDANCMYKLGDMYSNGFYVEKDVERAFKWYYKAYTHLSFDDKWNHTDADIAMRLGKCYLCGIGVEKNIVCAGEHLFTAYDGMIQRMIEKAPFCESYMREITSLISAYKTAARDEFGEEYDE